MDLRALFLPVFFLVTLFVSPAAAQGVAECGTPEEASLEADPEFTYCDIHSRRFLYKDSQETLRAQIDARRENYQAPAAEVYRSYQQQLQALHGRQDTYNQ